MISRGKCCEMGKIFRFLHSQSRLHSALLLNSSRAISLENEILVQSADYSSCKANESQKGR
jgi:hypothetical protein